MDNSIRIKTEALVNTISLTDDSINYKSAITIDIAYCVANVKKQSIVDSIKHILFPLHSEGFANYLANYRILFSSWVNRADYNELLELISKDIDGSIIINLKSVFRRKFISPTKLYFNALWQGLKMKLPIAQRLYVASKLVDYVIAFNTLTSETEGRTFLISKYIPLNSSYGLENVITQFLNQKNCKTFHLCHGLHFSPNYRFFSVDAFNKELITAEIVLSWGQGFVDNAKEFGYTHYIVGNPKYPDKPLNIKFHSDSCIIFLARGQYDNNNVRLLEILSEYSKRHVIKITIKPHPTDNIELLSHCCKKLGFDICLDKTIKELLMDNSFGFAISYETTAYFEAMYYELVCLRFSYEENESYGDLDNRFFTCTDLENQITKYKTMDLEALSASVKSSLQYEIGMGINKYKEILA